MPADQLTKAELRVAILAARGCSNQEIATELYVSVNTVKTHVRRVLDRLGVRNKAHMVAVLMADPGFREAVVSPSGELTLIGAGRDRPDRDGAVTAAPNVGGFLRG